MFALHRVSCLSRPSLHRMSENPSMNWAKVASSNLSTNKQNESQPGPPRQTTGFSKDAAPELQRTHMTPYKRRSPSPSHVPRTTVEDENLYVLTLLTDKPLHERMTDLRRKYFPKKINKLAAHLTFFHALPESKLESSIIPVIKEVAAKTAPFQVRAEEPFRMKKGFAISVSNPVGGRQAKQIHQQLQLPWKEEGFLSTQDAGGCRLHYTLMNKVDDETEVAKAFGELTANWKGDEGTAEGLALWRYDRGFWRWHQKFVFRG